MIKVGVIGCGGISRARFRGWRSIPEKARVVAVADIDEDRLAWAAKQVDDVACHREFGSLLEDPGIDAVDICLSHHLHCVAIVGAAQAGKHILCEKPLCRDMEEAGQITSALRASGVTMMCAHNQLFWPSIREAAEILDSGMLGRPLFFRTLDCFRRKAAEDSRAAPGGWRADPRLAGGGELLDTGYHPTYRLLHLARSAPEAVSAMAGSYHLLDMRAEDSANVMVSFADGALGNILTSWAFASPVGNPSFQVVCEHGELSGDGAKLALRFCSFPVATRDFEEVDHFAAEIEHFADSLLGGREPLSGIEDGIATLAVILAAYRSCTEGITVRLEQDEMVLSPAGTNPGA